MFKPMLATAPKLDQAGQPVLSFPLYAQPKLDGIRASVVNGKLLTRTLKRVPNREVYEALSHPQFNGLDGELIVGDPTADDCYRKTASFCMSQSKTGEQWTYYVFDLHDEPGQDFEARLDSSALCRGWLDPRSSPPWRWQMRLSLRRSKPALSDSDTKA
jgi:ATP-dependent DNA ligase